MRSLRTPPPERNTRTHYSSTTERRSACGNPCAPAGGDPTSHTTSAALGSCCSVRAAGNPPEQQSANNQSKTGWEVKRDSSHMHAGRACVQASRRMRCKACWRAHLDQRVLLLVAQHLCRADAPEDVLGLHLARRFEADGAHNLERGMHRLLVVAQHALCLVADDEPCHQLRVQRRHASRALVRVALQALDAAQRKHERPRGVHRVRTCRGRGRGGRRHEWQRGAGPGESKEACEHSAACRDAAGCAPGYRVARCAAPHSPSASLRTMPMPEKIRPEAISLTCLRMPVPTSALCVRRRPSVSGMPGRAGRLGGPERRGAQFCAGELRAAPARGGEKRPGRRAPSPRRTDRV